ncbi:Lrp/AsnC family transcriptional regulator [Candidatus Woesearchaeota archaeon]|nr:Lrp/AsnC family transcriptional regulator [Candidatus Woesearchaeota archaeon]
MKLDALDMQVLEILEKDSKLSIKQISKMVKKPITTIHNRIKKLELQGIITQYTIKLNYEKLGRAISAYILITVKYLEDNRVSQSEIGNKVKNRKEVESVSVITGEKDIIIKVRVASISQLNKLITNYLRNIEGIDKTETMIVLEEIKS